VTEALRVLQRVSRAPARPEAPDEERCELCAEPIASTHGHVVNLETRRLVCACRGCYLLFTAPGSGGGHFRAVPDGVRALPAPALGAGQWERLQIPVGVAFFFFNSSIARVAAFYPGPAGATESELPLDAWAQMVEAAPVLDAMEPDVEALLVRSGRGSVAGGGGSSGDGSGGVEGYIVPIDACYELVGQLRHRWRGFDGGSDARDYLNSFFAALGDRAR
jgi:Family of unknown function (DUF5947)